MLDGVEIFPNPMRFLVGRFLMRGIESFSAPDLLGADWCFELENINSRKVLPREWSEYNSDELYEIFAVAESVYLARKHQASLSPIGAREKVLFAIV